MTHNRLAGETSPYLLQHKANPVHWWAWGPEALAEAAASNRPILLSVGYAACHWCHVMAHESFEDGATAAVMNELYVNIKVDREERPDIDAIYMTALHALGEQGGWPLTMFLTPAAEPFWGGTYFPKGERFGRPGFVRVLREISRLYHTEPGKVAGNAAAIRERLTQRRPLAAPGDRIDAASIADLAGKLAGAVDPVHGGLRGAPKFPQFSVFWLLWQAGIRFDLPEARGAVLVTLRNICQGGIYDHIGGGFARYSVDEQWLVPHFEKMLYDNALLLQLLTEAWRETQESLFRQRIITTADWLVTQMRTPEGGFASSYDADSEGEEGKFYVWTPAQIRAVLGADDAALFCRIYDITEAGNFEGHNIANRLAKLELEDFETEQKLIECQRKLRLARAKRVPPGWDDKVLADWNGLAIVALAEAGRTFERPDWIGFAQAAFAFVATRMSVGGRLWHAYRAGKLRGPGTASDYAGMIAAALALHQVTGSAGYLREARAWEATLHTHYWIAARGGYAFTAGDTTDVIIRTETAHDDATPNANGVMVANLVRLYGLTGHETYMERAESTLRAFLPELAERATGHTGLLAAAIELTAPLQIVIIVAAFSSAHKGGKAEAPLMQVLAALSLPGAVQLVIQDDHQFAPASPLFGKTAIDGKPTAYVCVGGTCSLPVTEAAALRDTILRMRMIKL